MNKHKIQQTNNLQIYRDIAILYPYLVGVCCSQL